MPAPLRAVRYPVAVLLGAAAGLLGSFRYNETSGSWPVGMLLAYALTASIVGLVGLAASSRVAAVVAAGGWFVMVFVLASEGPGRDLVVPGTTYGQAWLFGGFAVAMVAAMLPYDRAASGQPPPGR